MNVKTKRGWPNLDCGSRKAWHGSQESISHRLGERPKLYTQDESIELAKIKLRELNATKGMLWFETCGQGPHDVHSQTIELKGGE